MATTRATLASLLLSSLLLFATAALSTQKELEMCKKDCEVQHSRLRSKKLCKEQCEDLYKGEWSGGRHRGAGREEEQGQNPGRGEGGGSGEGQQWSGNPYFYDQQSFKERVRTEHGHYKVLERFTKKLELLRGIDNYRLTILKANPQTFIVPHHSDADSVYYVIRGRGSITMLSEDNRETHQIRRGDIFRVPSGATTYLVNTENDEQLYIAKIFLTISTPGKYEDFIGAGGENPESFYRSFSNEVLEAAFNTPRDRLDRLFGQQRKGAIIKASKEQIGALSQQSSSEGMGSWPFGESKKPYNLLSKRPAHFNNHGQLYEATQNDYEELQKLDIDVAVANITGGSMMAPSYNTKATKLALVVSGRGWAEVVCPHMAKKKKQQQQGHGSEGEQGQSGTRYQKVRSNLSPGTVFIIPAGHPVVAVSSSDENLVIVCFGMNAKNNKKHFLAGKNNIMKQMENEAKELSFGVNWKEVDQVLNAQDKSVFLPGPKQGGGGGGQRYGDILEFAAMF